MIAIGAIVIGRLDSSRLPGKVLTEVKQKPLLWYVLSRCQRVGFDKTIVATSDRPIDDPIAAYCQQEGVNLYRGDAADVAGRVLKCAQLYQLDYFARVNADSPFLDPPLLQQGCEIARTGAYDFVTNLHPRSFPYGVSVEIFRTTTFQAGYARMTTPDEHEHVTKYFYDNIRAYRYYNIQGEKDMSAIRLTIDTPDDLERFHRLVDTIMSPWNLLPYTDAARRYQEMIST